MIRKPAPLAAAILVALFATPAFAQESAPADKTASTLDTIIVTGRLKAEEYNRDGEGFKNVGQGGLAGATTVAFLAATHEEVGAEILLSSQPG